MNELEMSLGTGKMFDAIACRYDFVNRVLSLGIDRAWRRKTIAALELKPGARVLDVATGTGDVALALLRRHPDATVEGIDPSARMLEIGRTKAAAAGCSSKLVMRSGDAMALPHADASFDACTIAFGIRNVPDRPRALREMFRVLVPGGKLAILELTEPRGLLGPLARFHVHRVVPRLGALLSGAREYRYLEKSIAAFPAPETFAETMREAGFTVRETRPLTFGVATLFLGERPR